MDRIIRQLLDHYEQDLLTFLEVWNVSYEDVLDALDQIGYINLENIIELINEEETFEED